MSEFVLEIPIDLSEAERLPDESVRATGTAKGGVLVTATAKIGRTGKAKIKLPFKDNPTGLRVFVGPATVDGDELPKLQTMELQLSEAEIRAADRRLILDTVVIAPKLWYLWRRWCRTFKVSGRVVCLDRRPVQGAEVTAFDVDWCWWWTSKVPVATAVTDENGFYEMTFRWCCGYWPYWWWHNRHWRLEPELIDRIRPILELHPDLPDPPRPTPVPDPEIFERLVADIDPPFTLTELEERPQLRPPFELSTSFDTGARRFERPAGFDPTRLLELREPLIERLPEVEELARLRIWPWYPWCGWADCAPDLVFRITQDCGEEKGKVLIDENLLSTRWNVDPVTEVNFTTLFGCCRDDTPPPEGDCLNLTHACSVTVHNIGGSPTAAVATPAGYASPGSGDRPFAGNVTLYGDFGTASQADYYELEWFDSAAPGGGSWKAMPPGALAGFTRYFHGAALPAGPVATHPVSFPVREIGGRRVIESRKHFQDNNGAGTWEVLGGRWWNHNKTVLGNWKTEGFFADGTHKLRVKSWRLVGPDTLGDPRVLGICGAEDPDVPNELPLRIDNRILSSSAVHGHDCGGAFSVHTCTDEPETRILSAQIVDQHGNVKDDLAACSSVGIDPTDELRITFRAHDADGHLSHYNLQVTYGDSLRRVLIGGGAIGGVTLSGAGPVVGPTYANARAQALPAVISPTWHGGDYIVSAPAAAVFPETCCYQIELRAYKRTIVNCNGSNLHRNLSERSFMIQR